MFFSEEADRVRTKYTFVHMLIEGMLDRIEGMLDRSPRLRRLATGEFGASIGQRIEQAFPDRTSRQREVMLRGYLRHRLANRVVYKATLRAPTLAALAARCVPIENRAAMERANALPGPIIIAAAHFGSLYFQSLVLRRLLRGRRLVVMHERDFADAQRDSAFVVRQGCRPVPNDAGGLRSLLRALREDRRTAILIAFDPTMGNRHVVRFLGTTIPVAMGVGMLADVGRCPVLPIFWSVERGIPRITVLGPVRVNDSQDQQQRRTALVERLYRLLEDRVARFPEQWMLWEFIRDVPAGLTRNAACACAM